MADIRFKLNASNLGPHVNLVSTNNVGSLQIGIYATNGSGKTFISRALRCVEAPSVHSSNKLIAFNQTKSNIELEFFRQDDPVKQDRKLKVLLERDKEPIIENNTNYIFHIFNSDYVNENMEILKYKPNGEIEGYILGKELIDLSNERAELSRVQDLISKEQQDLTLYLSKQRQELDALLVRKSTTEYIEYTFENIFGNTKDYPADKTFDELKSENTLLNALPDDLPDVPQLSMGVDYDFFKSMEVTLSTSYTKGSFSEEFKRKLNFKKDFIEAGLTYLASEVCPFCEQDFNLNAIKLIDEYQRYMADEEAKIIGKINSHIQNIEQLKKVLRSNHAKFSDIKISFDKLKGYLPSYKQGELKDISVGQELSQIFEGLIQRLVTKKENIEFAFGGAEVNSILKPIVDFILIQQKNGLFNNTLIKKINDTKSNLNKEKLEIKKRLCRAKFKLTVSKQKSLIENIKANLISEKTLKLDIAQKEQKVRASKKELVAETFEEYLSVFFNGKYSFDRDNFCLKFNTVNLIDNASDVLSEGEKSIVAFCYYLAETHKKVSTQDDYEDLFFVIDDPISSLDFHYVYSVAQIIRKLNTRFSIGRLRFLLLTHSIEFMSILIRNKIISANFSLRNQKISKISRELIMPYEEHLRDIYEVSINRRNPSHTTPNSIRHVIETLNKFEKPQLDLQKYFEGIEVFSDNAYLYSLIHDNSHGNFRQERGYVDGMVIDGCKKLVEFITEKFGGQISILQTAH